MLFKSLPRRVKDALRLFICLALSARELANGICNASKAGRTLPRLTLMIPCHALIHWLLFVLETTQSPAGKGDGNYFDNTGPVNVAKNESWKMYSCYVMIINLLMNAIGYTILIFLYRHSVQTIFNRKIPTVKRDDKGYIIYTCPHPAIQSFNTHLLMLRPLEIFFRFITAPMRVLPDVIILGETRCGTTNLCGHIVSLSSSISPLKCYTPFCPWAHPELDHKESFYFVGHYLGEAMAQKCNLLNYSSNNCNCYHVICLCRHS